MHNMRPEFEFDPAKNSANLLKHRVGFAEAATCFLDEQALVLEDAADGEARWILLGRSERGRLLVVAFAWRRDSPRLISARKATARENRAYEGRV